MDVRFPLRSLHPDDWRDEFEEESSDAVGHEVGRRKSEGVADDPHAQDDRHHVYDVDEQQELSDWEMDCSSFFFLLQRNKMRSADFMFEIMGIVFIPRSRKFLINFDLRRILKVCEECITGRQTDK